MSKGTTFDWYQLSKMNQHKINLQSFAGLIKYAHFGQQLNKVPVSLRQKLLIAFQNASQTLKNKYIKQQKEIGELTTQRNIISHNINILKQELQGSMQKINQDKALIQQKIRILQKIKQKIKKKQAQKTVSSQKYFCPLCTRQDFASRNQFSIHLLKQHGNKLLNTEINGSNSNINESSSQQTIPAEVKDFILSLKDKQIQLMEMMLNKKKQIQSLQMQQKFQHQIRKIKTQANFMQRKSAYTTQADRKIRTQQQYPQQEQQQLKGQSQYLFYEQDNSNKQYKGMFREQIQKQKKLQMQYNSYPDPMVMHQRQRQHYNQKYSNQQHFPSQYRDQTSVQVPMQRPKKDYYNIFGEDQAFSQVDHSLSPQKFNQYNGQRFVEQNYRLENKFDSQSHPNIVNRNVKGKDNKKQLYLNTQNKQHKNNQYVTLQDQSINQIKPLQPVDHIYTQSKIYKYNDNQNRNRNNQQHFNNANINKFTANNSIYRQDTSNSSSKYKINLNSQVNLVPSSVQNSRNNSKISQAHIFNSGPLMDDAGDGSDYQYYFGNNNNNKANQNSYKFKNQQNRNKDDDQIIDEQIIIVRDNSKTQSKHQNNSLQSSHTNNNSSNLALQYSKDKSFLQISNSKQKSSDLIQLSNSFSKRALQQSKSNQTINLSDLKFSKLQRQRQKQKERMKQSENRIILNSPQYQHIQYMPSYANRSFEQYQSRPNILQQFKRQQQIQQHTQQKYDNNPISKTQKPNINLLKIKRTQNIDLLKTNPGVLEQFLFRNNE